MATKLTKQKTFDTVYRGLAKQGFERSINGEETCVYRGDHHRKCAAGILIPDELYDPAFENGTINPQPSPATKEASRRVTKVMDALGHDLYFVRDLQRLHDNSYSAADLKLKIQNFARDNDLKIPAI